MAYSGDRDAIIRRQERLRITFYSSLSLAVGCQISGNQPAVEFFLEKPLSMQMNLAATIFHIASDADINRFHESNFYRCASLEEEGFIHCCEKNQLAGVVQRYYHDIDDVHLMLLDPDTLSSPLIRENTTGGSELFPHIYGAINSEAVRSIIPFGLSSTERLGLFS